jgi:hypothetical protein
MSDSPRRGRCNRIPRNDGDARHHAADRRRGVAFNQNLAGRLVHRLDEIRILFLERRLGVFEAGLQRAGVQRDRLGLFPELLGERLLHQHRIEAEQLREDARIDHVAHQAAQLRVGAYRLDQRVERYGIKNEVAAQGVEFQRLVVHHGAARLERQHIFLRGLGIHRDEEVHFLLARDVVPLARANRVPGREPGDVRREHVLARDRDTHEED